MRIFHFMILLVALIAVATGVDEKNRGKRQQIPYYSRRSGARPPPYAVQMEPIIQYSQRDPLYNPLANSKSDNFDVYQDDKLYNYYGSSDAPEPIIEIIIKESNESLPAPPTSSLPPSKPTKEPIQVFYVKYEKKDQGNGKSHVIYDKPIPALSPHEEHEEINSADNLLTNIDKGSESYVPPVTTEPTTTTTLRAIIRPDSETFHAPGGSGIRVTFGTDQLPPNNHKKRSDRDNPTSHPSFPNSFPPTPPSASKRQHSPFSLPPLNHHRVPPAVFGQQRIVNSFSSQQQYPSQQSNLSPPPLQYQSAATINNNGPRPQRPPITIQGLPEVQQRLPFQSFPPHRISINHPQQPGFPPAISVSHQSVHLQNQPTSNFNGENQYHHHHQHQEQNHHQHQHQHQQQQQQQQQQPQPQPPPHPQQQQQQPQPILFKQPQPQPHPQQQQQQQQPQPILFKQPQNNEKQKYHEQRRQQEALKQREQHRQAEILRQEQQRQAEFERQAEIQRQEQQFQERQRLQQQEQQSRFKQEKIRQEQLFNQPISFPNQQLGSLGLPNKFQQQPIQESQKPAEILKAVPKLEQHFAIRENPRHPGPFPPNPQFTPLQYPQNSQSQNQNTLNFANFPPARQQQSISIQKQTILSNPVPNLVKTNSAIQYTSPAPKYQTLQPNTQYFNQEHQSPVSHAQSIWGQPKSSEKQKIFATPVPKHDNIIISSTPKYISTTTPSPPTTTTTQLPPSTPPNQAKIQANIANLPDEVPDDIREQLLSSGILGNADIQVLDYDKIGDTPIENLPPEALANFYGGGGGAVAASAPIPAVAKKPKITLDSVNPKKVKITKVEQATLKPGGVEMKVVHFDPNTAQGQAIADQHIQEDATQLKPVTVGSGNDGQYNRYLPLKVSGTSFPIPNVPELKDRKISSVVVLAPVDYNFRENEPSRNSKKIDQPMPVRFLAGETLRQLFKKSSAENFNKWFEQESRTEPQKQSVILLVTTPKHQPSGEKEIYMFDVTSRTVSKLAGDLSSAFVDAAESNSDNPDPIDDSSFSSVS